MIVRFVQLGLPFLLFAFVVSFIDPVWLGGLATGAARFLVVRIAPRPVAAPRSFERMEAGVRQRRGSGEVLEIGFGPGGSAGPLGLSVLPTPAPEYAVVERAVRPGELPLVVGAPVPGRDVVVVLEDAFGRELDWRLAPDPGDVATFSLVVPAEVEADVVVVYRPRDSSRGVRLHAFAWGPVGGLR